MSRKEDRTEGAMRIFGALSGVQREYLEACEKEEKGKAKGHAGRTAFKLYPIEWTRQEEGNPISGHAKEGIKPKKWTEKSRDFFQ